MTSRRARCMWARASFAPVAPEVWNYSVSGLQVVKSWLDYRKRRPGGKQSSPLDEIRPEHWEFGGELLAFALGVGADHRAATGRRAPAGRDFWPQISSKHRICRPRSRTSASRPSPPSGTAPLGGGSEA